MSGSTLNQRTPADRAHPGSEPALQMLANTARRWSATVSDRSSTLRQVPLSRWPAVLPGRISGRLLAIPLPLGPALTWNARPPPCWPAS